MAKGNKRTNIDRYKILWEYEREYITRQEFCDIYEIDRQCFNEQIDGTPDLDILITRVIPFRQVEESEALDMINDYINNGLCEAQIASKYNISLNSVFDFLFPFWAEKQTLKYLNNEDNLYGQSIKQLLETKSKREVAELFSVNVYNIDEALHGVDGAAERIKELKAKDYKHFILKGMKPEQLILKR